MKRTLALFLAAIMVVSMLPVAMLTASAHGLGVGVNQIDNLTYNNGEGTDVPATVTVDGVADDTAWGGKEWNLVTSHTGVWSVTTAKNASFAYKYQLFTDFKYLYGVFVVDTNAIYSGNLGEVTVYINDGSGSKCTDKIVLTTDGANATIGLYDGNGNAVADKGTGIDVTLKGFKNVGGVYTFEFRTLTSNVTETDARLSSYVSVAVGGEKLYYPRFSVSDGDFGIDPSVAWPSNAVEIESADINATSGASTWGPENADMSKVVPTEIHVDGQLNEGIWESFTDYYRSGKNMYEYRTETEDGWNLMNLTVGYSDSMYRYVREDGLVNKYYEKTPGTLTDPFNPERTSQIWYYAANDTQKANLLKANAQSFGTTAQNITLYEPSGVQVYYDADYLVWDTSPVSFKYDLRADAEYLYGAIVANVDCTNKEFYYYLQSYNNPTNGQKVIVPTYFFIVFNANGASNTYSLRYDTTVEYNAEKGIWELAYNQTTQKDNNGWVGAKRISRYLINLEFALPFKSVTAKNGTTTITGLLKDGKYYDADTDGYTADELEITHTLAVSNTPSMYTTAIYDLNGDGVHDYTPEATTVSYYNNNGGKSGNVYLPAAGNHTDSQHFIVKVNTSYSNYTPYVGEYYDGTTPVASAYHAWSIGGGLSSSKPIYARADKVEGSGAAQIPDGDILPEYYANLLAADPYVNGMGRNGNNNTGVEGKGEDLDHDAVGTFYHEFYADSEYLYGAAVIMPDDGDWLHRTGTSDNKYDALRLWINSGHGNWGESCDYLINFYINDITYNSSTASMGVIDVYSYNLDSAGNGSTTKIASSQSASEALGSVSSSITDVEKAGYGMEVAMHTTTVSVDSFIKSESGYTSEVAILEFRIPLEVIGVSSLECEEAAFYYALSSEYVADSGAKGLCWPLLDNNNLESGSNGVITDNYDDERMSFNPWNALERDSAIIRLNQKKANTITLDGTHDEEIWNNLNEREVVNAVTGTWDVMPLGKDIFDYSYKVYTGRNYVYGMAEISAEDPTFTLWVNADGGSVATNRFDFKLENGAGVCYNGNEKVTFTANYQSTNVNTPSKVYTAKNGGMAMHTVNGKTYLEFMLPMDEFETARDGYEYVVSVTVGDNTLYHPDNSNTEYAEQTMWLSQLYNDNHSGAGAIITDDSVTTSFGYTSEAAFAPTEYEGIYKVVDWIRSNEKASAGGDKNRYLDIPEGGFVYAFGGGNPRTADFVNADGTTGTALGETYVMTLTYSARAVNILNSIMAAKESQIGNDLYFKITGLDADNQTQDLLYDDQWNSSPEFYEYCYGSDVDYSVVSLTNNRVLTNDPEVHWDTANDLAINSKERYYPETIVIDGSVRSDYGWDENGWTEVYNNVNGNTNNSEYFDCETEFGYKYQMRVDDEYVYVAAVINTPVESPSYDAVPAFRIWIQSKNTAYTNATSFTHLFDVRPGTTTLSVDAAAVNEYLEYYNTHYLPADLVNGQLGADAGVTPNITLNSNGVTINSGSITFDELLRAAENKYGYAVPQGGMNGTVVNKGYGETAFYGNTLIDAENLRDGAGNEYTSTRWFASVDVENYIYGNEHACFGENEDGDMVVEFKFALADIGCENGEDFEYYVEARSEQASESDSYCLFYPPLPNESCVIDGDYARSYHFPYWVWGNNAFLVDSEARAEMSLRNPKEPVSSLGAQVDANYTFPDNSVGKALRFGVLYRNDYLGSVYGKTDMSDASGWDGVTDIYKYATYWDVKDIGVIISPAKKLSLSGNDVSLTTATSSAEARPSDTIVNHQPDSNMADYTSYVSYVVMKIPDKQVNTDLAYRGYVEYYRYGDIYYDFGETESDIVTYRPTYYSDPLVRSFSLVEKVESGGFSDPVIPIDLTFNVVNSVNNANVDSKSYLIDASGFKYVLTNETTGETYKATTDSNGQAKFNLTYTAEDVDKSYVYTLTQEAGDNENVIYDSNPHEIEVDIALNDGTLGATVFEDGFATPSNSIVSYFNNTNSKVLNGTKVVYVPLDNRPVNLDRAYFLADSAEIELVMPPENIVSTTLENEGGNYTSDQGNPLDILNWLQTDPDVQSADYFVLSVDQILSGGLVGSRAPFWDTDANTGDGDTIANTSVTTLGNYTLTQAENDIINYINSLCNTEGKKVYLFDTVMRLASTSGYAGWNGDVYGALRDNYAYKERYEAHTLEDIIANYTKDANGNTISTAVTHLTDEIINTYLLARERKLRLVDKLYKLCGDDTERLYIGVDDSVPNPSIQTNEIAYITGITTDYDAGGNRILFAGADELGLTTLSAAITDIRNTKVDVKVTYFSEAGKDYAADNYDHESCKNNVEKHIKAVGGNIVTSGADMEILVLTRSASAVSSTNATVHTANVTALIAKLKSNQAANIPTCVVDASGYNGYGELARTIISDTAIDMGKIMGFSAWNTVGNAVGISLSNAIGRYSFLMDSLNITDASHKGFMKGLTYSFIKDEGYKNIKKWYALDGGTIYDDFQLYPTYMDFTGLMNAFWAKAGTMTDRINAGSIYTAVGVSENKFDVHAGGLYWPWFRNFEANFTVDVYNNGSAPSTAVTFGNIVSGDSYTTSIAPSTSYPDSGKELTNGTPDNSTNSNGNKYSSSTFSGYWDYGTYLDVTFSFDDPADIYKLGVNFANANNGSGVNTPYKIEFVVTDKDGNTYVADELTPTTSSSASVYSQWVWGRVDGDCVHDVVTATFRIYCYGWIFLSELSIYGIE